MYRGAAGKVECRMRSRRHLEETKKDLPTDKSYLVGSDVIFSHKLFEDLEKLWEMRELVPDPKMLTLPSKMIK